MENFQFCAIERVKFKAEDDEKRVWRGRKGSLPARCYIKAFGLSPAGMVKAKGLKQENDMIVYLNFYSDKIFRISN